MNNATQLPQISRVTPFRQALVITACKMYFIFLLIFAIGTAIFSCQFFLYGWAPHPSGTTASSLSKASDIWEFVLYAAGPFLLMFAFLKRVVATLNKTRSPPPEAMRTLNDALSLHPELAPLQQRVNTWGAYDALARFAMDLRQGERSAPLSDIENRLLLLAPATEHQGRAVTAEELETMVRAASEYPLVASVMRRYREADCAPTLRLLQLVSDFSDARSRPTEEQRYELAVQDLDKALDRAAGHTDA
ncbi:hypothetical protein LMG667_19765 [Xanthomonas euvesicatoria]|uniref:hypothetical protein n=1 Tax=Xanthomonas euvesicatoria TaxID=456327 RepID=UPI00080EB85E|nr:hypothetical protein [Xanthomonas euvesicatoria]OCG82134.1 hypothetical protein LMG667_19765 [Xanthomonas euvesicatoria]